MIKEANMTRGTNFEDRKTYIERDLKAALMPVEDFNGIKYARTYQTEQEYVKVDSLVGTCAYLNITAVPKDRILRDVIRMVCFGNLPTSVITDSVKIRTVAKLFM